MENIIEFIQLNWEKIIELLIYILVSIAGFTFTGVRTSKKSINKKIDNTPKPIDISKMYTEINGQKIKLEDLKIKKEKE